MSKWIPYPAYADTFPIDIRCAFGEEAPAGKHGFLTRKGRHMIFEDGTQAHFWGANFNSGLCFPTHEYAKQLAERVSRAGINLVRLHQMDADWSTPNIFQFAKGARLAKTGVADPECMDRMDYLVYCLKAQGVYIYLDILTYRKFRSGDGVANADRLGSGARFYNYTDPKLIELQKEFMKYMWTHVNPYTGLAYKDDPAIVLTEIVNEDDLFARRVEVIEPYYSDFSKMFGDWALAHGYEYDKDTFDPNVNTPELIEFKIELMENHYKNMMEFTRSLGVKIPICGTNWTECGATVRAQKNTDFNDGHAYLYWIEHARMNDKIRNYSDDSLTAHTSLLAPQIYGRLPDKPYFISEWDEPWPMECRAESPIVMAAVGCLQDWSGICVHTYAYTAHHNEYQPVGMEVSSRSIGMGYHRQGQFATWNDPAKFGVFPHAALMMRRADVSPARGSIAIKLTDMTAKMEDYNTKEYLETMGNVAEYTRAGVEFDDLRAESADSHVTIGDKLVPGDGKIVKSDTGELFKNIEDEYGTVDSPRTQAAYGYIGRVGRLSLGAISLRSKTDFAVIAASSLSDEPLNKCDNMLLTAVGRVRNTDERREGGLVTEIGRAPINIEVIEADIELCNANPTMKVWGVSAEGFYTGEIPSVYEDGKLKFTVGDKFPSMYYHIRTD